jgi:hypothetical protein
MVDDESKNSDTNFFSEFDSGFFLRYSCDRASAFRKRPKIGSSAL